jgi:hypothetical protein
MHIVSAAGRLRAASKAVDLSSNFRGSDEMIRWSDEMR